MEVVPDAGTAGRAQRGDVDVIFILQVPLAPNMESRENLRASSGAADH